MTQQKNGTVKINGKEIPYDFQGKLEMHLNPMSYGVFDVIGKKDDNAESGVLYKNAIVSFIDPEGEDENLIALITNVKGTEPYVVDCATYEKICSMKNLEELKSSVS